MADKTLNDTKIGVLRHEGNELLCDSTVNDAAAFRGGAPTTQRTLVKFVGDVIRPDGKREEVGQMSFKQSETHNVVDGRLGGEGYYGLRKPNAGSVDSGVQDIWRAYPENTHPSYPQGAFVFEVPVIAPNLGGSSSLAPSCLRAPGGQCELHCQGDGNAVMYDVRPNIIQPVGANDQNGWVPLSTLAGGRIRDFREDGDYSQS